MSAPDSAGRNSSGSLITLPNAFTLSRVLLVPVFLVAFLRADAVGYAIAYGILAICESSDVLDGAVARARGQVSDIGKLLDPLADTITRFCMFLGLLVAGVCPLWIAVVLFIRDISIAYLRSFAAFGGVVISARWSGKIKAVAQAFALFATLAAFLVRHQNEFAFHSSAGFTLIASALIGIIAPVLLAFAFHLDKVSLTRVSWFAALMLLPLLAIWFVPGPLPSIDWLVPLSLWVAVLVTVYSFVDYLLSFHRIATTTTT